MFKIKFQIPTMSIWTETLKASYKIDNFELAE